MSAKFFLDTNIFIYSFDSSAPRKQKKSQALIETALESHTGSVSWQRSEASRANILPYRQCA
jgi:predicted nucleic acid-binding protein